jgi:hypothetical protein
MSLLSSTFLVGGMIQASIKHGARMVRQTIKKGFEIGKHIMALHKSIRSQYDSIEKFRILLLKIKQSFPRLSLMIASAPNLMHEVSDEGVRSGKGEVDANLPGSDEGVGEDCQITIYNIQPPPSRYCSTSLRTTTSLPTKPVPRITKNFIQLIAEWKTVLA